MLLMWVEVLRREILLCSQAICGLDPATVSAFRVKFDIGGPGGTSPAGPLDNAVMQSEKKKIVT